MRCLECNHALDGRTTRCPYCGGNVFGSDHADAQRHRAAAARSIWDEPRSGRVVTLQPRISLPALWMLVVDGTLWLAIGILSVWWLGTASFWQTWLALGLAVAANTICLMNLQAAPWWFALWRLLRRREAQTESSASEQTVNIMN